MPGKLVDVMDAISIHAPRTGSDALAAATIEEETISIHAPRTGSDAGGAAENPPKSGFQSTLPARGATSRRSREPEGYQNFNPRSPHGERRVRRKPFPRIRGISIHAPRTGSDALNDYRRTFAG